MNYQEFLDEWRSDSDCIVCHTSGSTGTPARIELPKEMVRQSAARTVAFFGLDRESVLYSCISPDFIGGKMQAVRAHLCRGELFYETPSNRPLTEVASKLGGRAITLLSVVPSQLAFIVENIAIMPRIEHVLVGGAPLSDTLAKKAVATGLDVYETYGMTETASHIALRHSGHEGYFRPLEGISLRTDDGCLCIGIPGWDEIKTHDIVRMQPDVGFSIIGRSDNVIISGGCKVHPEEIEKRLKVKFGGDFMITSAPDPKWGEKVILIIEPAASGSVKREAVMDYCRKTFRPFEVPKEIVYRTIPRTSNGKILRSTKIFDN